MNLNDGWTSYWLLELALYAMIVGCLLIFPKFREVALGAWAPIEQKLADWIERKQRDLRNWLRSLKLKHEKRPLFNEEPFVCPSRANAEDLIAAGINTDRWRLDNQGLFIICNHCGSVHPKHLVDLERLPQLMGWPADVPLQAGVAEKITLPHWYLYAENLEGENRIEVVEKYGRLMEQAHRGNP